MQVTILNVLKMQELSDSPGDASAPQQAKLLVPERAFLQGTNTASLFSGSTAEPSTLSPC